MRAANGVIASAAKKATASGRASARPCISSMRTVSGSALVAVPALVDRRPVQDHADHAGPAEDLDDALDVLLARLVGPHHHDQAVALIADRLRVGKTERGRSVEDHAVVAL